MSSLSNTRAAVIAAAVTVVLTPRSAAQDAPASASASRDPSGDRTESGDRLDGRSRRGFAASSRSSRRAARSGTRARAQGRSGFESIAHAQRLHDGDDRRAAALSWFRKARDRRTRGCGRARSHASRACAPRHRDGRRRGGLVLSLGRARPADRDCAGDPISAFRRRDRVARALSGRQGITGRRPARESREDSARRPSGLAHGRPPLGGGAIQRASEPSGGCSRRACRAGSGSRGATDDASRGRRRESSRETRSR